jgi:peptide/nickel transport system permease protein
MFFLHYAAKRLAMLAGGLVLILLVSFCAIYRLPGDPARMILGPRASAESIAEFRAAAGLNDPVAWQLARFARNVAKFDFGESLGYRRPVASLLLERSGQTLRLVTYAVSILLLFAIALPLCLRAAGLGWVDDGLRTAWAGLSAAPPYVLAILTLTFLAGFLQVLPAVFDATRPLCWVASAFVLAVYPTALTSRLFRNALLSASESEYATRARAQGFGEAYILFREALVNALTAPVSALANGLAYFFTGTFFVEVAFGIGGIGSLTYDAIRNKDITLLAGVCVLFAVAISVLSALLDLGQLLLNPKFRRGHAGRL